MDLGICGSHFSLPTDLLSLTCYRPELYIAVSLSVSLSLCVCVCVLYGELYIATVIQEEGMPWMPVTIFEQCVCYRQTANRNLHTLTSPSSSRSVHVCVCVCVCVFCVVVALDHHYQAM